MIASLLLLSLMSHPAQEAASPADFLVAFDGPARALPPGLGRGMNDLSNASAGCWQTWARETRPQGGLARIWAEYAIGSVQQQIEVGLRARAAGLDTYLCAVGAPENQGKGHGAGGTGIPPRDAAAWAEQVARDVKRMEARGVPVRYVEIWNEPNFPGQWNGTEEEFARFFAESGRRLHELLPEVRIGGPGMATAAGTAQPYFRKILAACKAAGWAPDFLSWHFYASYPGDNERCRFGERLAASATAIGLPAPEMILSEWNIDLPDPVKPELDDHRAGVYFAAVNSSLANTPVTHSQFFFLQDGFWEAKKDYGGESVGVFTLRGGPKAVLNGMRMFRTASELPAVPVERREAPWNLGCLATRQGDRGYLLLTNAFGDTIKSARHLADAEGVDFSFYQDKERELVAWAGGKISYEQLGGRPEDRTRWEVARAFVQQSQRELAAATRTVRIAVADPPKRVVQVWRLDAAHGNPARDAAFQAAFRAQAVDVHRPVARRVIDQLRQEGVEEAKLAVLEDALAKPDQEEARRAVESQAATVGADLSRRAATLYREAFFAQRDRVPGVMAAHPAAALPVVPMRSSLRREGDQFLVELPPWSAVLIEVSWAEEGGREQG